VSACEKGTPSSGLAEICFLLGFEGKLKPAEVNRDQSYTLDDFMQYSSCNANAKGFKFKNQVKIHLGVDERMEQDLTKAISHLCMGIAWLLFS
jgi:type VI protein secretion system component VasF